MKFHVLLIIFEKKQQNLKLCLLQNIGGTLCNNSPTQAICYIVISGLNYLVTESGYRTGSQVRKKERKKPLELLIFRSEPNFVNSNAC